jgi:lipopolysaccharide export system ATP-binding protein
MELTASNLVKTYRGRTVVKDASINVNQGEIVGLLGTNGAGKTTSFYMMVGLVKPDGGQVVLDGKDITKLPMFARARLGMGYLAQEMSVFRKLTAEQNVELVLAY